VCYCVVFVFSMYVHVNVRWDQHSRVHARKLLLLLLCWSVGGRWTNRIPDSATRPAFSLRQTFSRFPSSCFLLAAYFRFCLTRLSRKKIRKGGRQGLGLTRGAAAAAVRTIYLRNWYCSCVCVCVYIYIYIIYIYIYIWLFLRLKVFLLFFYVTAVGFLET